MHTAEVRRMYASACRRIASYRIILSDVTKSTMGVFRVFHWGVGALFFTLGGVVAEHRAVARLVRTEQNKLIYFANINILIQEHQILYIYYARRLLLKLHAAASIGATKRYTMFEKCPSSSNYTGFTLL